MTSTTGPRPPAAGSRLDPDAGRVLVLAVVLVAAAAWAVLLLWPKLDHGAHPAGELHGGHHAGQHHPGADPRGAAPAASGDGGITVAVGWALMVLAMMLPPALPLLQTIRRIVARRRAATALVGAGATAFLVVWLLAGVGFLVGDLMLGLVAQHLEAVRAHPQIPAGLAAVAAGLYQFTPAKRACLAACRSPRAIALGSWRGTRPAAIEAAAIGWRFGLVCVGCCWALMLLTFTVGAAVMPVMIAVGVVMLAERLLPRTRPLVPAVAVGCLGLGVLILVGAVPPGLV